MNTPKSTGDLLNEYCDIMDKLEEIHAAEEHYQKRRQELNKELIRRAKVDKIDRYGNDSISITVAERATVSVSCWESAMEQFAKDGVLPTVMQKRLCEAKLHEMFKEGGYKLPEGVTLNKIDYIRVRRK